MGGGAWTTRAFVNSVATSGYTTKLNTKGYASSDDILTMNVQDFYRSRGLAESLNPYKAIRECCDSEEHPNTVPIIFALDVTGSMGQSAKTCAGKLDEIMGELYEEVKDVEFMMMGIGDLAYDSAPIQATQFESDVRIMDQTTKIWFEQGGGGNQFESYTAAWYFGLHHTDLDCWKRGKKGLIITMGDEPLNPYLPGGPLNIALDKQGNMRPEDIETNKLYKEACKKFDIYHIAITDNESSFSHYKRKILDTWGKLLGQHCLFAESKDLPKVIGQIVDDCIENNGQFVAVDNKEGISW